MSFTRFAAIVAGTLAITLSASLLLVGREDGIAAAWGAGVAGLNAVAAYGLVLYSRQRSTVVFMRAILGGMTLRMGAMLLAIVIGVRVLDLPQAALVLSLLFHFTFFLGLELLAAHRVSSRALESAQ